MKRLHATALAAALAAAVPAWGDPPADSAPVMTLNKDGKAHQYKILKTYKHPSGGTAYDVKDEATGEIMTVIEDASPAVIQSSLKPEVVIETPVRPAVKADPILQPAAYADEAKWQKMVNAVPAPPAQPTTVYTRQPVPATQRWLGWMSSAKPAAAPVAAKASAMSGRASVAVPTAGTDVADAAYHSDPVFRLIACLRDDLLPSMREVAAIELASSARGRVEVVDALVWAAGHDPAPTVRLCCVGLLREMRVQTPACEATLQTLRQDRHDGVRAAAEIALMHWQQ
jgi:hypothetical protein